MLGVKDLRGKVRFTLTPQDCGASPLVVVIPVDSTKTDGVSKEGVKKE